MSNNESAPASFEEIQHIADYICNKTSIRPQIAVICGSGLGSLANVLSNCDSFDYEEIPNFPVSTVSGHASRLIFGYYEKVPIMCMQGRFHPYEGYPLWKCAMPVRVMKLIGITHLMVTNGAGGLNPKFKIGDLMLIRDHINWLGLSGNSALKGPNDIRFGPRFPSMANDYDRRLIKMARKIAKDMGARGYVHSGIYSCCGGPNYETVAEWKMLRSLGVDAVGMSTAHEVITARHCSITVFGFSLITNRCSTELNTSDEEIAEHDEVVQVEKAQEGFCTEFACRMFKTIQNDIDLMAKHS